MGVGAIVIIIPIYFMLFIIGISYYIDYRISKKNGNNQDKKSLYLITITIISIAILLPIVLLGIYIFN